MKNALMLAAILLLTSTLAWAEGAAGPAAAGEVMSQAGTVSAEGGCNLPSFAGLSADQRLAAAVAAGFQTSQALDVQTAPLCPEVSNFHCTDIANCKLGSMCSTQSLGPCCDLGDGILACCATGSIRVRQCLCTCTRSPCWLDCLDGSETTITCS
jgi:hypothetical protein